MFCFKCWANSPNGLELCPECGSPLPENVPPTPITQSLPYAGFFRRAAAFVLDVIILFIGGHLLTYLFAMLMFIILAAQGKETNPERMTQEMRDFLPVFGYMMDLIFYWLYFAIFQSSSKQATPGKMALKLVVTAMTGKPISFIKASFRYCIKFFAIIVFVLGVKFYKPGDWEMLSFAASLTSLCWFALAGFTKRKQSAHDFVANTLVVRKKK